MSRLRSVWLAVWDFVVGDDWRLALGVVLALGVTALAAGAGATAWWIMPAVIAARAVGLASDSLTTRRACATARLCR
jgi:hypothetical protein